VKKRVSWVPRLSEASFKNKLREDQKRSRNDADGTFSTLSFMDKNIRLCLTVLRYFLALILFMIGIVGLFLPFLQGFLFIILAIAVAFPGKEKEIIERLRQTKETFLREFRQRWRKEMSQSDTSQSDAEPDSTDSNTDNTKDSHDS